MLALTVDRYWYLCRKLQSILTLHQQKNDSRLHLILFALIFGSFIYCIPRFFELKITYYASFKVYFISYSDLMYNPAYMLFYRVIGSIIFYSVVPYIFVFMLFMKYWAVLRHSDEYNLTHNSRKLSITRAKESNKMLIAISMKFLLSRMPSMMVDIYEIIIGHQEFYNSEMAMIFVGLSNFVVIFASASTFFLFLIFSRRFRSYITCRLMDFCKFIRKIK